MVSNYHISVEASPNSSHVLPPGHYIRYPYHHACLIMLQLHLNSSRVFSHLKRGIQDFHMNYVLVPADKAANNVVVV